MTAPTPETVEREKDKYLLTDAELRRRLGVPEREFRRAIQQLDSKPTGFPKKQKLWGDRRWWPAVEAYFNAHGGILQNDAARLATETRDRSRLPRRSSQRSHHAEGHSHD